MEFFIPGKPKGKGRPRFAGTRRKPYTPDETVRYEQLVKYCYQDEAIKRNIVPISADEPVAVYIRVCELVPKSF